MTLNEYFDTPEYVFSVAGIITLLWFVACLVRVVNYYTETGDWIEDFDDRFNKPVANPGAFVQMLILWLGGILAQFMFAAFFFPITWYIVLTISGIAGSVYFIATRRRRQQVLFSKLKGNGR